jgi:hypothetical protein
MIKNFYLKIRYNLFKKWITPIKFGTPDWEEDFNNPSFEIWDQPFYSGHSYISPDCVEIDNNSLYLKVKQVYENVTAWGVTQFCHWKMGAIMYKNKFKDYTYGTWVFKVVLPRNSFAAIWFLRHPHPPEEMQFECGVSWIENKTVYFTSWPEKKPGPNWWLLDMEGNVLSRIFNYDEVSNSVLLHDDISYTGKRVKIGSDHITPEIDLMEVIHDKIRHTIHWGFSTETYRLHGKGMDICTPDWTKEYEFALKSLPDRYEFYIDGIKTGEYTQGVYDKPIYPILNNAVHKKNFTHSVQDFVIKSIKFYKHE